MAEVEYNRNGGPKAVRTKNFENAGNMRTARNFVGVRPPVAPAPIAPVTAGLGAQAAPSAASITVGNADPLTMSKAERDSFVRQGAKIDPVRAPSSAGARVAGDSVDMGGRGRPASVSPTQGPLPSSSGAAPPPRPAPMPKPGLVAAAPAAAAPVVAQPAAAAPTVGGRIGGAAKSLAGTIGKVATPIALGLQANTTANTTTDQYRDRFGGDADITRALPGGALLGYLKDQLPEAARDVVSDFDTRVTGTVSDIAAGVADLPASLINLAGGSVPTVRDQFADVRAAAAAGQGAPGAAPQLIQPGAPAPQPGAPQPGTPTPQPQAAGDSYFIGKDGVRREITPDVASGLSDKLGTVPAGQSPLGIGAGIANNEGPAITPERRNVPSEASPKRIRELLDVSTPAGKLYAELSRNKSKQGQRIAAQFINEYLGAGVQEGQTRANFIGNQEAIEGQQAVAGIQASGRQRPAPAGQTRITNDGRVISVADGIASEIPVRGSTSGQGDRLNIIKEGLAIGDEEAMAAYSELLKKTREGTEGA